MVLGLLLYGTHAIYFSKLYAVYSYFESVYILTGLSIYPIYYIYILLRAGHNAGIKTHYKHFLPAIVLAVLSLFSTFLLPPEQRVSYVRDILINKNLGSILSASTVGLKALIFFTSRFIFLMQVIFYAIKGISVVAQHTKKVHNYYSNVEGKTLNRIRDINVVILFVSVSSIIFTFIGRSYFSQNEVFLVIPSLIFSAVLFIIGFNGNQEVVLSEHITADENLDAIFEEIESENGINLKSQLIQLFEEDKIYKYPNLRITTVSEKLETNRTYISKLINDEFGMNFNEFVNQYRIIDAKYMLSSELLNIYTLEHIAEKSGFGSVASFSRVFKEIEGVTPGKFRTQNRTAN
uniref:helix-turn-helix domain-containing protein n=1 Tax=uncultured Draconibacterium sp. TaxID=1573823 RepID=UPI0032169149